MVDLIHVCPYLYGIEKEIYMIIIKVTKLEKQVLESLANGMYAELGYSDMGIEEVAQDTNLSHKVLRGVVGSLEKKGLVSVDNRESEGYKNKPSMHIWYLSPQTEGLVKHWVGEQRFWDNSIVEPIVLQENQ